MTGFVIREKSNGGSILGYVSQTDPQGRLPTWLVNTVTQSLAPKLARKLEKAALAYPEWKEKSDNPNFMPWRWPDQINSERITVSDVIIHFLLVLVFLKRTLFSYIKMISVRGYQPERIERNTPG